MDIAELLRMAREQGCSDVHITAHRNPVFRKNGDLFETDIALSDMEKECLILDMLDDVQKQSLSPLSDFDFAFSSDGHRHRVNIFHQQGILAAAVRIISDAIPSMEDLGLPKILRTLAAEPRGLILVTGPTGSGKSTTLAAMIDFISGARKKHILTIEDPIEYVYRQKQAMVQQREVGVDVESFSAALRSAMREDPDVILVGEMRDHETISAALTAAETGHLVLSTLHTGSAADTVDRVIDVFPAGRQQQVRTQLAGTLKGVATQQLLPRADGTGRVAAFEIMVGTDAVLNLIRESKGHQLDSTIQTGSKFGMVTMDNALADLVRRGIVSLNDAMERAKNGEEFSKTLQAS